MKIAQPHVKISSNYLEFFMKGFTQIVLLLSEQHGSSRNGYLESFVTLLTIGSSSKATSSEMS